jgi:hypothetical protein
LTVRHCSSATMHRGQSHWGVLPVRPRAHLDRMPSEGAGENGVRERPTQNCQLHQCDSQPRRRACPKWIVRHEESIDVLAKRIIVTMLGSSGRKHPESAGSKIRHCRKIAMHAKVRYSIIAFSISDALMSSSSICRGNNMPQCAQPLKDPARLREQLY